MDEDAKAKNCEIKSGVCGNFDPSSESLHGALLNSFVVRSRPKEFTNTSSRESPNAIRKTRRGEISTNGPLSTFKPSTRKGRIGRMEMDAQRSSAQTPEASDHGQETHRKILHRYAVKVICLLFGDPGGKTDDRNTREACRCESHRT